MIGKIAVGDFLDQMNWHDIRDRIVGSNLTGIFFSIHLSCLVEKIHDELKCEKKFQFQMCVWMVAQLTQRLKSTFFEKNSSL